MGEIGKFIQWVETSGYKKKKKISRDLGIWGSTIKHGDYSQQDCIIDLKIAKTVNLKYSHCTHAHTR